MDLEDEAAELPTEASPTMSRRLDANMDAETLRQQAERCRRLAGTIGDRQTAQSLATLADEYQQRADGMQRPN